MNAENYTEDFLRGWYDGIGGKEEIDLVELVALHRSFLNVHALDGAVATDTFTEMCLNRRVRDFLSMLRPTDWMGDRAN